jgi:DNA-binding IclR family transcriptional regulator
LGTKRPARPVSHGDSATRKRRASGDSGHGHAGDDRGWQSIGRALKVLDIIGSHQRPVSLTDISSEVQLTISTTHRILRGLEARGFVQRDPVAGDYSVGPSILRLASSAMQQTDDGDLALLAFPRMQRLRELTKETVGFHVVNGLTWMCIAELPSHEPIRMVAGVGTLYPLGLGAPGKAMLAHMPRDVVARVVAGKEFQARSRIGRTMPAVMRSLTGIVRDGYAISDNEVIAGASGVAIPILDARGEARAALNITGPEYRWTKAKMMRHLDAVREVTEFIERRLGRA